MKRRIAAIIRTVRSERIVAATWEDGCLSAVATSPGPCTTEALGRVALPPSAPIAVVLPSTEAGHRVVTIPAGREGEVDAAVALETRGSLPSDPGPLRIIRTAITDDDGERARMAVSFVREATLDAVRDELAAVGASASRIDAAPMPVWALVADRTRTAIVVRDADAAWVAGVDAHGAPRFFRPLHAAPSDPDAIAREVARTFTAWRVRPERVLLGGPGSSAWRAAIERTSAVACEELAFPTEVDPALADDPLAAGALLTLARRKDLPLALVAPAILPTARRRRLAGLATAAVLLLVAQGALTRMELASRLRALEVGITAVTRDAGPRAAMAFERLDAVTEPVDLPAEDPALARLYEVVSHVPTPTLQLQRLQIDAKHVTLVGRLPSFDAVEALRRGLERSPRLTDLRVAEMRASLDATGVEFRLEGRWLRSGEQPS